MPYSRTGRAWIPTLAALIALLAFAPQAGATDYGDEPVGCMAVTAGDEGCTTGEEPKPQPKPEPDDPASHEEGSCESEPLARGAGDDREAADDGCLPRFVRPFLTRVWKFVGEVDYYEAGELSMTLGKILNLPRKWRAQDDELLDQDATVLVSNRVRVFRSGERVARDELDTANDVRVHGKLLRPRMWRDDEDGSPVPTIRAKKVYITG